jgi:hypothetical protein
MTAFSHLTMCATWCAAGDAAPLVVDGRPIGVNGNRTLYFRGARLFDALLESLRLNHGLLAAHEVLFAGCSAGALTVLVHADRLRFRLPPSIKVAALADAMFSLDGNSLAGPDIFAPQMKWVYAAMNSSAGINPRCLAAAAPGEGWGCLLGATAARYVQTPLMMLQSKYDTWQGSDILGLACKLPYDSPGIGSCSTTEQAVWVAFGKKMITAVNALPPTAGIFLSNCPRHCRSGCVALDLPSCNDRVLVLASIMMMLLLVLYY